MQLLALFLFWEIGAIRNIDHYQSPPELSLTDKQTLFTEIPAPSGRQATYNQASV